MVATRYKQKYAYIIYTLHNTGFLYLGFWWRLCQQSIGQILARQIVQTDWTLPRKVCTATSKWMGSHHNFDTFVAWLAKPEQFRWLGLRPTLCHVNFGLLELVNWSSEIHQKCDENLIQTWLWWAALNSRFEPSHGSSWLLPLGCQEGAIPPGQKLWLAIWVR